jgi:hypothetical protein
VSAPRFTSLDDYLASLDAVKAATLRAVVNAITGSFPDLTVKIAWNVPQIHRGKAYVFGMSAATGMSMRICCATWWPRAWPNSTARWSHSRTTGIFVDNSDF